ncbi:MAG: hypothetical protein ACFFG0_43920 [Candidatus Thorarchaeota archaeon]
MMNQLKKIIVAKTPNREYLISPLFLENNKPNWHVCINGKWQRLNIENPISDKMFCNEILGTPWSEK